MRVVRSPDELKGAYESASNEALTAFGDGSVFIERYVESPRHIEIQILADGDRHGPPLRARLLRPAPPPEGRRGRAGDRPARGRDAGAVRGRGAHHAGAGYVNAGTVEFLVDPKTWKHYFIEVNPRIQVEHTVTEVITGVDLVQSQMRIAAGQRLNEIGLAQDDMPSAATRSRRA